MRAQMCPAAGDARFNNRRPATRAWLALAPENPREAQVATLFALSVNVVLIGRTTLIDAEMQYIHERVV